MNYQMECDQFNVQREEDNLPVFHIESDAEYEIKRETEEFEIEPLYQLVPFIKTEPEDSKYIIKTEIDECENILEEIDIKQETEPVNQLVDSSETTLMVEERQQSLKKLFPDFDKKFQNEQKHTEDNDSAEIPVVDDNSGITYTGLQKEKYVDNLSTSTEENAAYSNNRMCTYKQPPDKCDVSKNLFHNKFKPTLHALSVLTSSTLPVTDNSSSKSDSNKLLLATDAKHAHGNEKRFPCDLSKTSFMDKSELVTNIHEQKPFSCYFCHKILGHKSSLVFHLRRHTNGKPYSCDYCSDSFINDCDLKKHTYTHANVKQLPCNICNKLFNHNSQLMIHSSHHPTENTEKHFVCDSYGKSFNLKPSPKKLKRILTKEEPFFCNFCGRSYKDKSKFKKHRLSHSYACNICGMLYIDINTPSCDHKPHTGEKPFLCRLCPLSFSTERRLRKHTRVHSTKRPFSCIHCHKSFALKHCLNDHIRRCHKSEK